MLTLLLVDSELERVPAKLTGHQQVVQSAQRTGLNSSKMLLDSSLHYAALRGFPEGERRGRPDLVHFFLLTVLESIPNRLGTVRVFVHTRNDELIRIRPDTRLIRNYGRFCGLMQQLFEQRTVGTPDPLLTMEGHRPLASILKEFQADRIIILDPGGEGTAPAQLFDAQDSSRHVLALIGGFPSGEFRSPIPPEAERVSIFPDALTVWTVAAELLAHYPRPEGATTTR